MTRTHWLILLLAGVVCLLPALGKRVLTEHEVFAAEPAREMLAGQGWLLQPFAGEYRTKKPPGQSWLIAASLAVTRSHSEFAARLPSALAGIGLSVVVAAIAARLGGSRRGLIAGLMTLTCVGVQQRARLAEADMALAFCVALANACLVPSPAYSRGRVRDGDRRRAGVFWMAIVAGFMLKGPIVLGFTALPAVVAWAVLRFGTNDPAAATALRRSAFWWPAVVGGVALIVAWPVAAGLTYPPAVAQWRHEIVDRVQGQVGHGDEQRRDPVVAYLWLLPQATLPWCVFAVPGAVWAWRNRRVWRRPANVLLACWGICGLLVVSAIAFKVLHYVLPAVAAVVLLAAYGFDRLLAAWLRGRRVGRRRMWRRLAFEVWFLPVVLGLPVLQLGDTKADPGEAVPRFASVANDKVPAGQTLYLYDAGEERSAWYLDMPLRQVTSLPPAPAWPLYVLCRAESLPALAGQAAVELVARGQPFVAREPPSEIRMLVRLRPPGTPPRRADQ